jgi:hypothetical protein
MLNRSWLEAKTVLIPIEVVPRPTKLHQTEHMPQLPPILIRRAEEHLLIPVVGAGVSMSLKTESGSRVFPSWYELLELAAIALTEDGKQDQGIAVGALLRIGSFKQAADIAEEAMKGPLWNDFLRRLFDVDPDKITADSMALPRALWSVTNRLITLNFDKVLRYSCPSKRLVEFNNSNSAIMTNFCRAADDRFYAWHLHGNIDDTSSLILSSHKYAELYGSDTSFRAAITTLNNIVATHSLLFVGCSLSDAELIESISSIANVFDNSVGPHYALVHKSEMKLVSEKLKGTPIKPIEFEEFGKPLEDLIFQLKRSDLAIGTAAKVFADRPVATVTSEAVVRIAVLICDAVDSRFEDEELLKELRKIKCEIHYFPLNLASLNNLDEFDYIFILTSNYRGKIIIEDEWLSSSKLELYDLIENIPPCTHKGIFIFATSLEFGDASLRRLSSIKHPLAIYPRLTKAQCASIGFKLFKKNELSFVPKYISFNELKFQFLKMGNSTVEIKARSPLSELIDPKTLKGFVGRTDDLRELCRLVISHIGASEVLTIKGSGGIGKTSISKMAAIEFSSRGIFSDGIWFVDCEFITDYVMFESEVALVFNLQAADKFKEVVAQLTNKSDRLIILDNAESLLVLKDAAEICALISYVSDFCSVLVTSREPLNLENESVRDLRRLTTDEAYELFVCEMSLSDLSDGDKLFIRERIVEDLLDNNPLAIKLVARNTPKGKDMNVLWEELDQDVFSKVRDEGANLFNRLADRNVERKRSIFASINYSYKHLNDKEKVAFELLSLFPDGINMENFKKIAGRVQSGVKKSIKENENPINKFLITDATIKSLLSKSVIEINNNNIYLQSLISRFSEHAFKKRGQSEVNRFRRSAFHYNVHVARAIVDIIAENPPLANRIYWRNQKNFIRAIGYCNEIGIDNTELCNFLDSVATLGIRSSSYTPVLTAIERVDFKFEEGSVFANCLNIVKYGLRYFNGEFEEVMSKVRLEFPLDEIKKYDYSPGLHTVIASAAINLYSMEGETAEVCKVIPYFVEEYFSYPDILFVMGEFDQKLIEASRAGFFTFEARFATKQLSREQIDDHIKGLYKEQHLDRMQANYVRFKLMKSPFDNVNDLVVVNPYSSGIKDIILASSETNLEDSYRRYQDAIKKLSHIKYYCAEAHYYFAKFLRETGDPSFASVREQGMALAEKHSYRHLLHLFRSMLDEVPSAYESANYPLSDDVQIGINLILKSQYKAKKLR